jgi:hypothetical protein
MRRVVMILCLMGACFGGWFVWKNNPGFLANVMGQDFHTFKVRFGADKIMDTNKTALLKIAGSTFLEPKLTYFPYLLMEVKYTKNALETREGMLLWGLSDGEMVLDVDTWLKTHGFEDCLMAKVNEGDFKILRALAEAGGVIEKGKIAQRFSGEEFEKWCESCVRKKLIVDNGNKLRLHLQNPRLEIEPHTKLGEWVVTLPEMPANRSQKRYSPSQVQKMTHHAFGTDFAIRRTREVYLPVYEIAVQHADGSILTTYWNGLNGKQIDEHLREI